MILADSSVWIDYFNGRETSHTNYLFERLGQEPIAIGDLMLVEVLQGFDNDKAFKTARSLLLDLPILTIGSQEIALAAADNYRRLRRLGTTVRKTIDTLIATFCIVGRHELLFTDRDFRPFVQHLGLKPALSI